MVICIRSTCLNLIVDTYKHYGHCVGGINFIHKPASPHVHSYWNPIRRQTISNRNVFEQVEIIKCINPIGQNLESAKTNVKTNQSKFQTLTNQSVKMPKVLNKPVKNYLCWMGRLQELWRRGLQSVWAACEQNTAWRSAD